MGRRSTKENKTIWQITREELGLTREKAGELIPGFSPERIEILASYEKTSYLCIVKRLIDCFRLVVIFIVLGF